MRTDHTPHASCYKSSGPTPVKCNCWMFCPLKSCRNQWSRSIALAFSKEDFVTLSLFIRPFSSCLQLLPAQKQLNCDKEISWRGGEGLVGRTVLLRHSYLPARGEKVVLIESREGKRRGEQCLSLHHHLPLEPILKVKISFSSVSVMEGTTGISSHLSVGAFEGELCHFELLGKSFISRICRGPAHTLQ